jgi:hypothetical protein
VSYGDLDLMDQKWLDYWHRLRPVRLGEELAIGSARLAALGISRCVGARSTQFITFGIKVWA